MPYPRKLLNDYETLALDLHPHWWYFAESVFSLIVSVVLGVVVVAMDAASSLKWVVLILIVLSALWVLHTYLKWITTHFVITSDRVIFRHGVVAKSGIEIPLERRSRRPRPTVSADGRSGRPAHRIRGEGGAAAVHGHPQPRSCPEPHPLPDAGP